MTSLLTNNITVAEPSASPLNHAYDAPIPGNVLPHCRCKIALH